MTYEYPASPPAEGTVGKVSVFRSPWVIASLVLNFLLVVALVFVSVSLVNANNTISGLKSDLSNASEEIDSQNDDLKKAETKLKDLETQYDTQTINRAYDTCLAYAVGVLNDAPDQSQIPTLATQFCDTEFDSMSESEFIDKWSIGSSPPQG